MFPVKLWIAPQRAHQRPQSPQATHKTKGLHETDFFFTELLQLVGLLALNNLILYPSHKWNMTHSFIKGRHYSVNGLWSQLEETVSDMWLLWPVDTLGLKIPNTSGVGRVASRAGALRRSKNSCGNGSHQQRVISSIKEDPACCGKKIGNSSTMHSFLF